MKELLDTGVSQRHITLLTVLLGAATLPHGGNLKLSLMAFFFALLAARLWIFQRYWKMPGRPLKMGLTALGVALVYIEYRTLMGMEGGVALLVVMLGLKTLELRSRRDLYLTLFLTYFLIITQFLYSQTILLTLYMLTVVWGLTGLLVAINRVREDPSLAAPLRLAGKMLLQAVPLMIILFIVFPRLSGPLWSMKLQNTAMSGLSDSMSPGSFDKLIESREIAFRVHFRGSIPPPQDRYWRAPVMWRTTGRSWHLANSSPAAPPKVEVSSPAIEYDVVLEANTGRWLPALDLPLSQVDNAYYTADFQLIGGHEINNRRRYSLTSHTEYTMEDLSTREWEMGIQLPNNITPRMEQLVSRWQENARSPQDIVNQALDFFNRESFYYTLEPPLLQDNPVDQFLFDSRRGFCEHYASAFATLMRIAQIPTRIVAGYQGGELNPMGDYLIVRQSDAHAWTEVWLDGQGWVRVDPTAAVAPQRILQSIDTSNLSLGGEISFGQSGLSLFGDFNNRLALLADSVNTKWQVWVLSYNNSAQSLMLAQLGLANLKRDALLLLSVILPLVALVVLIWAMAWRGRLQIDPARRLYDRFCAARPLRDIPRHPWEGPRDYAERIARHYPAAADGARRIAARYIALRYGPSRQAATDLADLKRLIRQFRVK